MASSKLTILKSGFVAGPASSATASAACPWLRQMARSPVASPLATTRRRFCDALIRFPSRSRILLSQGKPQASPDAQHALPNSAAEEFDEDDEVERDRSKHDQRRSAFELETSVRQIAGRIADRITCDREHENEVKHGGEHLAPGGDRLARCGNPGG